MRTLSASELLDVWERASGEHPVDRALTLLSACSEEPRQNLENLGIGRRDARLLQVYERLFGSTIEAFAQCPQCGERLEYRMSTTELNFPAAENEGAVTLETEERCFHLRLPNSLDLRAASEGSDSHTARKILLERCVVDAPGPTTVQVEELSESTVEKIASCLAQADPQAEMLIDLTCCACRHGWQVVLDVQDFLWVKINAHAKRLLHEVHALARAYGWREHDILALSAVRRQAYLEMAGSWLTF
jgi:hypothetical protein